MCISVAVSRHHIGKHNPFLMVFYQADLSVLITMKLCYCMYEFRYLQVIRCMIAFTRIYTNIAN